MKILFAADGSSYTKKALAFLVTHEGLAGKDDELIVLNVQPALPPRVKTLVGAGVVSEYQREEADKVLAPIKTFLQRHPIPFRCESVVGPASDEILAAASTHKVHLIVMGTHGHGLVGRFFLGSIAQRVVAGCEVPVLLVK